MSNTVYLLAPDRAGRRPIVLGLFLLLLRLPLLLRPRRHLRRLICPRFYFVPASRAVSKTLRMESRIRQDCPIVDVGNFATCARNDTGFFTAGHRFHLLMGRIY